MFKTNNMKEIIHIRYNVNGVNSEVYTIGVEFFDDLLKRWVKPDRIELIYAKGTLEDWIAEVYFGEDFVTVTNINKIYRGDYKVIT